MLPGVRAFFGRTIVPQQSSRFVLRGRFADSSDEEQLIVVHDDWIELFDLSYDEDDFLEEESGSQQTVVTLATEQRSGAGIPTLSRIGQWPTHCQVQSAAVLPGLYSNPEDVSREGLTGPQERVLRLRSKDLLVVVDSLQFITVLEYNAVKQQLDTVDTRNLSGFKLDHFPKTFVNRAKLGHYLAASAKYYVFAPLMGCFGVGLTTSHTNKQREEERYMLDHTTISMVYLDPGAVILGMCAVTNEVFCVAHYDPQEKKPIAQFFSIHEHEFETGVCECCKNGIPMGNPIVNPSPVMYRRAIVRHLKSYDLVVSNDTSVVGMWAYDTDKKPSEGEDSSSHSNDNSSGAEKEVMISLSNGSVKRWRVRSPFGTQVDAVEVLGVWTTPELFQQSADDAMEADPTLELVTSVFEHCGKVVIATDLGRICVLSGRGGASMPVLFEERFPNHQICHVSNLSARNVVDGRLCAFVVTTSDIYILCENSDSNSFALHDKHVRLSDVVDYVAISGDPERQFHVSTTVVCASGPTLRSEDGKMIGSKGTLRVLRTGIGVRTLMDMCDPANFSNVTGVFSLHHRGNTSQPPILVISYIGASRALQYLQERGEFVDITDSIGLAADSPTLCCGWMHAAEYIVQVTPSAVHVSALRLGPSGIYEVHSGTTPLTHSADPTSQFSAAHFHGSLVGTVDGSGSGVAILHSAVDEGSIQCRTVSRIALPDSEQVSCLRLFGGPEEVPYVIIATYTEKLYVFRCTNGSEWEDRCVLDLSTECSERTGKDVQNIAAEGGWESKTWTVSSLAVQVGRRHVNERSVHVGTRGGYIVELALDIRHELRNDSLSLEKNGLVASIGSRPVQLTETLYPLSMLPTRTTESSRESVEHETHTESGRVALLAMSSASWLLTESGGKSIIRHLNLPEVLHCCALPLGDSLEKQSVVSFGGSRMHIFSLDMDRTSTVDVFPVPHGIPRRIIHVDSGELCAPRLAFVNTEDSKVYIHFCRIPQRPSEERVVEFSQCIVSTLPQDVNVHILSFIQVPLLQSNGHVCFMVGMGVNRAGVIALDAVLTMCLFRVVSNPETESVQWEFISSTNSRVSAADESTAGWPISALSPCPVAPFQKESSSICLGQAGEWMSTTSGEAPQSLLSVPVYVGIGREVRVAAVTCPLQTDGDPYNAAALSISQSMTGKVPFLVKCIDAKYFPEHVAVFDLHEGLLLALGSGTSSVLRRESPDDPFTLHVSDLIIRLAKVDQTYRRAECGFYLRSGDTARDDPPEHSENFPAAFAVGVESLGQVFVAGESASETETPVQYDGVVEFSLNTRLNRLHTTVRCIGNRLIAPVVVDRTAMKTFITSLSGRVYEFHMLTSGEVDVLRMGNVGDGTDIDKTLELLMKIQVALCSTPLLGGGHYQKHLQLSSAQLKDVRFLDGDILQQFLSLTDPERISVLRNALTNAYTHEVYGVAMRSDFGGNEKLVWSSDPTAEEVEQCQYVVACIEYLRYMLIS